MTAEDLRLQQADTGEADWRLFGPYLSERQWGTVREDYSQGGTAWDHLPHDHARSRAYRWGEDGIAGISDSDQNVCFSVSMWNGQDPILKERLFGLTNDQGNHGEDVKEYYFYQDSTPTHSYMKMLYKYPQSAFPYGKLLEENAHRKATDPASLEYELMDTGVFDEDRYFDVTVEYAKRGVDDILVRITVHNHGPDDCPVWLMPTVWFRNTWSWKQTVIRPKLKADGAEAVYLEHPDMPDMRLSCPGADSLLFCENETNTNRLYGQDGPLYPKDGINNHVIRGDASVNPDRTGTKASAMYHRVVPAGKSVTITLRLAQAKDGAGLGQAPEKLFADRISEADAFYQDRIPAEASEDQRRIARQAHAGMLWSKQFFHYVVSDWLDGDHMPPPPGRDQGRNKEWRHFYAADIISMPDKWEYPWFASWDLSFHTVVLARTDLSFAKEQVLLLSREWYMRPDGQVPAYEWAFDDVNPPVQVWAGLKIVEYERRKTGKVDRDFLRRLLDHGLLYFTWWVNRKDAEGNNLYQGGFLGLDNISVFDRSSGYLPGGGRLYQSDGTTWVAFFALQMMQAAKILAESEPVNHEMAAKFFQHFALIADALDHIGVASAKSANLWDEEDGLYYDVLRVGETFIPLKARSLVSLIPMIAVSSLNLVELESEENASFARRIEWFKEQQSDLFARMTEGDGAEQANLLLSFLSRAELAKMLKPMLDPDEMLSDFGVRSMSKRHLNDPFRVEVDGHVFEASYQPAESHSGMFGGNSNWRGPIWMPINYLLIDALRSYHAHYGETFKVECPTGSGQMMTLSGVADELSRRLVSIFERDKQGRRPVFGGTEKMQSDPAWKDNVLFYEYFHGDIGAGIGASHQTGWTGLVGVLIEELAVGGSGAGESAREEPAAQKVNSPRASRAKASL
ncbi:glucosidase [Pararhizobium antarcticum]|uniref:Glucosidase n=1 Tax=Pararhizobium antarcticum TaxID=1798805 RepID=A0A657LQ32_9HYPH|nr:glucosidase [Pararhizobium antarcticum]OJF98222.1 glucosidase [Rhizobium sp. 58]